MSSSRRSGLFLIMEVVYDLDVEAQQVAKELA